MSKSAKDQSDGALSPSNALLEIPFLEQVSIHLSRSVIRRLAYLVFSATVAKMFIKYLMRCFSFFT